MKIKETRINTDGAAGRRTQTRVRELVEGETKPADAVALVIDEPVYDWKNEVPSE